METDELDLPLTDRLALDRTVLAVRRTWLASARTGLALFVAGASFLHFSEAPWMQAAGWTMLSASAPVVALGWWRYRRELRSLFDVARRAAAARRS